MGQLITEADAPSTTTSARSVASPTLLAVAVGAAVTGLVSAGFFGVGYRNSAAHLVFETAQACIALLVAYLCYGRFLRTGNLQDLLLVQGLALQALAGLVMNVALLIFGSSREGTLDVWLPLAIRVLGVALIAGAAVAGPHRHASVAKGERACGASPG